MALESLFELRGIHYLKSRNPATGAALVGPKGVPLSPLEVATSALVEKEAQRLQQSQQFWAEQSPKKQAEYLEAFHDVMYARRDWAESLITQETGKPRSESATEVIVSLDTLAYYARNTQKMLASKKFHGTNIVNKFKELEVIYQPKGVIAAIEPWNYPLMIPMIAVAQIMAGGNAVMLKPSEQTPHVGEFISECAHEAWQKVFGIQSSIMSCMHGAGDTGKAIIDAIKSGHIDDLHFTGSVRTGTMIYEQLASHLKNPVLELGGKDAFVVCDDADLESAAQYAVASAFYNCGQACTSTERVYVTKKNAQKFIELVDREVAKLKIGYGDDATMDIGPLISKDQLAIVKDHIADAVAKGASIVSGGNELTTGEYARGNYHEPTVLTNVNHSMKCMTEETFGPTMPIMVVDNEAQLIEKANQCEYGLTGSVWTKNVKKGQALARELNVGVAYVNDVLWAAADPQVAWKGVQKSGINASNGAEGFMHCVESKTIVTNHKPFYVPGKLSDTWKRNNSEGKLDFFHNATEYLHAPKKRKRFGGLLRLLKGLRKIK